MVATEKPEGLEGTKLLVVRRLNRAGGLSDHALVACDQGRAGEGDTVVCVASREATQALFDPVVPVDLAVVGIVEHVDRTCSDEGLI